MKYILKILSLFLLPVYGHTDIQIFTSNPVNIEWMEYGEEYEYEIEIFKILDDQETQIYLSDWMLENNIDVDIQEEGSYRWDIYIKEREKNCDDTNQCFNIESGYFDFYLPVEVEVEEDGNNNQKDVVEDQIPVEEDVEDIPVVEEKVLGVTTQYIPKDEYKPKKKEKVDEIVIENIIEKNYCKYSYNTNTKKFNLKECNIDLPKISSSTYTKYNDQYILNTQGTYQDTLKIYIENITCSNFDLLHPSTWFRCKENVIDRSEYSIDLEHEVYFFNGKIISPSSFFFEKEYFEISKLVKDLPTDIVYKGYFSLKHKGEWLDQELVFKQAVTFEELVYKSSGIYSFPFKELIPVNQWHGCTVYQCPHCGIDFASVRHNIYASSDGEVVSVKYDSPYSECGNGGKTITIKNSDGRYMAYMHLSSMYVKSGEKVYKGQLIAVSGNSGQYNCQPLGNHLHFELREGRYQPTHINPVPYIDVNWNLILTNKSKIFPGRLSGDNPHPNF